MTGSSAAKGAKATLIGQWLKFGVQMLSTMVLARILLPADFGLFSMVVAIVGLAYLLGDFGLSSATMQARELSDQQKSNLFWINLSIGVFCFALVWSTAPLIALLYGEPALLDVARALAPVFVLQGAVSQLTANAARSARYRTLASVDVSAQVIALLIAVFMANIGMGVYALVGQQLAVALWTATFLLVAARWVPVLPRLAPMRQLLSFGANSFLVQLLTYVSSNVDSVAIGRLWGAASLGLYDRAYQLFKMPIQQIASPLTRVVLPVLSRRQDELSWVSDRLVEIQRLMSYGIGGIFIFAAFSSRPLIEVLLGSNWTQSSAIFSVLAVGGFFQAIGYVYYWAFLVTNRTGIQLKFSVLTRLSMVGFIILGALVSPLAAAAGVSFGLFFNWLVLSLVPMRATGLSVRALVTAVVRPALIHVSVNLVCMFVGLTYFANIPAAVMLLLQFAAVGFMYLLLALCYRKFREDMTSMLTLLRRAI